MPSVNHTTHHVSTTDPPATRVAVVGSINMDLVARCERLPKTGQTVNSSSFAQLPGGKGANQAVAAAQLGAHCTLIGRVGDDSYGQQLTRTLKQYGVNTSAVAITADSSSGLAWINVDPSGENTITIVAGANGQLTSKDVQHHERCIRSANVVLVQLEVPLDTVATAVRTATAARVLTVLDPAPAPAENLANELCHVDVMTPNQTEAESLTGLAVHNVQSATRACRLLRQRGVRYPVITLGADGAVYWDKSANNPQHTLPPQVEVVDTTASGDAFTAALACRLASGIPLSTAVPFACAAGALAATVLGAQRAMPQWKTVVECEKRI